PGPQRGNLVLAGPSSPSNTEAIRRATAFLGSDASKLSARTLRQVLDAFSNNAEEAQEGPVEPEGCSAPTILQSTRGMVLGGGHQPPATRTTDNIDSPQRPSPQPARAEGQLPLGRHSREGPPNEDTATESESEPQSVELGPGDSVSQHLLPAPPPLCAAAIPPQPPLPPISHALHDADDAGHSNNVRMEVYVATADELGASDSDTGVQAAHACKRPRLGPSHTEASSTNRPSHPSSARSAHPTTPHATRTTAPARGPASAASRVPSDPPSTSDLSAVLHWAAQLAGQSTCPGTADAQGAGLSGQAGQISQPKVAFDLATKVLEALRSNLATTTTPTLRANPRKRQRQPKHTDPMVHRVSWIRGEMKAQVRPVVPFVYPFINPPRTRQDLIHNRELADKLLPNAFHCIDTEKPNEHQYEHPALRDCIAAAFFWAPDSVGMMYHKKFQPIPIPAVAMVLTVMQHCIKEWKTSRHVTRQLNAGKQLKVYDAHLKGLLQYAKRATRRLNKFQHAWFKYGVEYAGTLPEDEEPYQPITEADHVRPDTPMADAGAKVPAQ
ncbi:hypothetical protein FRC06_004856, partial [Ceratobasidium sp. 370]